MSNRSRTTNSFRNMGFGFANKFTTIILSFVSKAIFVRILSKDYLGINSVFADVLMMLSLAELGFGTAMTYSFYRPLAENDRQKIAGLIQFYKKVYHYIAAAVAVVGICLVPFLDYILNLEQPIPNIKLYYLVSLTNTVVSYLFIYKSSIIIADQKNHEIYKYQMWINVLKVIAQTVILYVTHSYLMYILVTVFTTILNNLLISSKADKFYPYIKEKVLLGKEETKGIFINVKSLFIYKISTVLLTGTDNILISKIVSTGATGTYNSYLTLTQNLATLSNILFSSLTASIGEVIIKESPEKRYKIFKVMQMVSFWLCGLFTISLYILADDIVRLWLGADYVLDHISVIAIAVNFYLSICLQPIWIFREATGLFSKTKYIMVVTAIENILLSIILGRQIGVGGIVIATFISKITTYFWYEPKILFKDFFEKGVGKYYLLQIKNVIVTGVILVPLLKITQNISVVNWFDIFYKAVICFVCINIVYLILNFSTEEMKILIEKGKPFLKKIRGIIWKK